MHRLFLATILAFLPASGVAQEGKFAKPELLLRETVEGMPSGKMQEISVLTVTFQPGTQTVFHTHRFPVTVYVIEGEFTLELEGRDPIVLKAGQSMVEPPHVRMTGFNRSGTSPLRVVIFYVAEPGTPFLDMIH